MKRKFSLVLVIAIIISIFPKTVFADDNSLFAGGDGSAQNPYQVATAEQLDAVRNDLDAHYIQVADIDLSGLEWEPIGVSFADKTMTYFNGCYDGNGYCIAKMTIIPTENRNSPCLGLFGASDGGTLKNIELIDMSINYVFEGSDTQLETFYSSTARSGRNPVVGGIVGSSTGTIENCVVRGNINVSINITEAQDRYDLYMFAGGITGSGKCSGCINYANVSISGSRPAGGYSDAYCGGITGFAGSVNGKINNCINYGNISSKADTCSLAGGISGQYGRIDKCKNYGNISSVVTDFRAFTSGMVQSNAGGIVAATSSNFTGNCVNYGNISATNTDDEAGCCAGGIVGYFGHWNSGILENCYNLGVDIYADGNGDLPPAGRICGRQESTQIKQCYSIDTVPINRDVIGPTTMNGGNMNDEQINKAIALLMLDDCDGFCLVEDGWSFPNTKRAFCENPNSLLTSYYIPRERYDEVLGSAYLDSRKFDTSWSGNCAGMSASAILFFLNRLNWETVDHFYEDDFPTPNSFYQSVRYDGSSRTAFPTSGSSSDVTQLVEAYQIYINHIDRREYIALLNNTYFEEEYTIQKQGLLTYYTAEHIANGTYIATMLNKFCEAYEENVPLYISLQGQDFGHAIVSRTDKAPQDMGNGWWRIYVYDPNKPYVNASIVEEIQETYPNATLEFSCNDVSGDIYMELNPSLNLWRYCTSVNSDSTSRYLGCNLNDEIAYKKIESKLSFEEGIVTARIPELFYTIDLNTLSLSDYWYPKTTAWMTEDSDNGSLVEVDRDSNCLIYNSDGELVAIVENGDAVAFEPGSNFSAYIGEEDGTLAGGVLTLPNDKYTVQHTSGQQVFYGNNNVVSVSGSCDIEYTVEIAENSALLSLVEDGEAYVRCANVFSADECSYVESQGMLAAGETICISFSDENAIDAYTDSNDGEIKIYRKDVDQSEAVAIEGDIVERPECNHEYEIVVNAATCLEQGYTTYTCSKCDDSYVADYVDPAGHKWDDGEVTKAPTEDAEGKKTFRCTVCSETKTEAIAKIEHSHKYTDTVTEPTCTEDGYTTHTCACGDSYTDSKVAATGHKWDNGKVTKEPTTAAEGEKTFTCTVCKEIRTEKIDKLPEDKPDDPKPIDNPFKDVAEKDYYFEPVMWAVENGVTSGLSADSFGPAKGCTRAQVVTFLWRAAGEPAPKSSENPFKDVKEGQYYYDAVLWAVENGVTSGLSADTFGPDANCNRGQIVTFLWRAKGKPAPASSDNPFTDVSESQYYYDAVLWAVEKGITTGLSATSFGPNATCTRGQIVTFLYRAYK